MENYHISVNQFAEFSKASPKAKERIVKQQLEVNKFLIPWYQMAKAKIRRYFYNTDDLFPILSGIEILKNKHIGNKRQEIDRRVSIEALERMINLQIPKILKGVRYEVIKSEEKSVYVEGVEIKISPEIIIAAKINGQLCYGGLKIHVSKGKPFDHNQASYVATLLKEFIKRHIVNDDGVVVPELCFCLDVFSDRLLSAPAESKLLLDEIKKYCIELKDIWNN